MQKSNCPMVENSSKERINRRKSDDSILYKKEIMILDTIPRDIIVLELTINLNKNNAILKKYCTDIDNEKTIEILGEWKSIGELQKAETKLYEFAGYLHCYYGYQALPCDYEQKTEDCCTCAWHDIPVSVYKKSKINE